MMKMIHIKIIGVMLCTVIATTTTTTTMAATIKNNTAYTAEFSGLVGGYTSANPLHENARSTTLLLDPGADRVRGHIMLYSAQPGHYVDNIIFEYQVKNNKGVFQAFDLYKKVDVIVTSSQLIIKP